MKTLLKIVVVLMLLGTSAHAQVLKDIHTYMDCNCVSVNAKDYYQKKFEAADDARSLSIVDSIWTQNVSMRPFYILLVSNMLVNADGSLADKLGISCKKFLEQHPSELIEFLYCGSKEVTKDYIQHWAYQVAGQIMSDCSRNAKECRMKSLNEAMKNCKEEHKTKLEFLYSRINKFCI